MTKGKSAAGSEPAAASATALVAAFAAVYLIWGSTYLAIRFSLESFPPFLMAGIRFVTAGAILYAWALRHGAARPSRREWGAAFAIGGLLFLGGNGAVVWAQQSVPSGVAALLIATEPILFVLLDSWKRGRKPRGRVLVGLALGLVGMAILIGPGKLLGSGRVDIAAAVILVFGAFSWALGSLFSRGSKLPSSPRMATSLTLLAGGALLLAASVVRGEPFGFDPAAVSMRSITALGYLITFGSLVGFSAYLWLLRVSTPTRVSTYAFVNPVVAVLLGWALAGEPLTPRTILAAGVIVGAVALIIRSGEETAGEEREEAAA